MKKRTLKIIGYLIYLILVSGLTILLFMMHNQINWVAGGLRELFTYSITGLTIAFLMVVVLLTIKKKNRKLVIYGLVGLIPFIVAIPFFESPIYKPNKDLIDKFETIELEYVAWACYCPRWVYPDELEAAIENDSLCMHIEPAFDSIAIPDSLFYSGNLFRFKGQFYKEKQYGEDIEDGGLAKTFRYTEYELIDTAGIWTKKIKDEINYEL